MPSETTVAVLTIRHAGEMTDEGRRALAAWLRRQATSLINDGEQYSQRFTARSLYDDEATHALFDTFPAQE